MATIIIPAIAAQSTTAQDLGTVTTNDQGQTNYGTQSSVKILFSTEIANSAAGSGISYDDTVSEFDITGSIPVQITVNTRTSGLVTTADNPATAQLVDISDPDAPVLVGLPWPLGTSHTQVFTPGGSSTFAVYAQAANAQPFAYPAQLINSELIISIINND